MESDCFGVVRELELSCAEEVVATAIWALRDEDSAAKWAVTAQMALFSAAFCPLFRLPPRIFLLSFCTLPAT